MHYKLRYWDELFQFLIGQHMLNGCDWNCELDDGRGSRMIVKRVDHESDSPIPFLRYTFQFAGTEVVYRVDNRVSGNDVERIILTHIKDTTGRYLVLDSKRDDIKEQILRDMYLFVVPTMVNNWYD